jgi:hypothetical protein
MWPPQDSQRFAAQQQQQQQLLLLLLLALRVLRSARPNG